MGYFASTAYERSRGYQPDKSARPKRTLGEMVSAVAAQPSRDVARAATRALENPDWQSLKVGDKVTSPYWDEGVVRIVTQRDFRGHVHVSGLGFCNSRVLFKQEE